MAKIGSIYSDKVSNIGGILSRVENYYFSMPVSTITNALNNAGLPNKAQITGIDLEVNAKIENSAAGDFFISAGFGSNGSSIGTKLIDSAQITDNKMSGSISRKVSIKSYMSSLTSPYACSTNWGSYFNFNIHARTIGKRSYWIESVYLHVTYETPKYTVTWKNHDGTVLETDNNVEYGATPTYNGATPTKASTAQHIYTFSGWSPSPVAATGNATYTAQFTATLRTYTVTFKSDNGATLKTETVAYGGKPTPPTAPVKPNTDQHKYTFDGWYDGNGNKWTSSTTIAGDTTYTARYTSTVQKYTVRWFNYDGTLLETDTDVPYGTKPTYNGATPTRPTDDYYTYGFAGWSPSTDEAIQGNKDFTAQFAQTDRYYTVRWVNASAEQGVEGDVLETDEVKFNTQPDYNGATPKHPKQDSDPALNYDFIGWSAKVTDPAKPDTELETVKGDITYTAIYETTPKLYAIRVILPNYDHTFLYEYGTNITLTAYNIDGYRFVQWSDGVTAEERYETVTAPATYEAVYVKLYNITAKVNDGSMGSVTQSGNGTYEENETVILTANSYARYYYLSDWLKDGVSLGVNTNPLTFEATENAEYTAVFERLIQVNIQQTVAGGGTFEITGAVLTDYFNEGISARIYSRIGDIVTIKAVPDAGYHFVGWVDGSGETENPRQITFTSNMFPSVYAKFERIPPGIKVNDSQIDYVYIVPDASNPDIGTIVYVINGTVPTVEIGAKGDMQTVDGWSFLVSNSIPENGFPLKKMFITDKNGVTTRIY